MVWSCPSNAANDHGSPLDVIEMVVALHDEFAPPPPDLSGVFTNMICVLFLLFSAGAVGAGAYFILLR